MIKLTEEQERCIEIAKKMKPGEKLKILAYAGTGKTFTLKKIAEALSNKKILYFAFNRAIAQESKKVFPKNTHVYTTHGFAYRFIRPKVIKKYNLFDVMDEVPQVYDYETARQVLFFAENFMNGNKPLDFLINPFKYVERPDNLDEESLKYLQFIHKFLTNKLQKKRIFSFSLFKRISTF